MSRRYIYVISVEEGDYLEYPRTETIVEATDTLEKAINVISALGARRYNCERVLRDLNDGYSAAGHFIPISADGHGGAIPWTLRRYNIHRVKLA